MYLLKISLRAWRHSWFGQAVGSFAMGVLLFAVGFLAWIPQAVEPIISRLANEQVMTAYLQSPLKSDDQKKLIDQMKVSLGAQGISYRKIEYHTAKDFVREVHEVSPDLSGQLLAMGPELDRVVPSFVTLTGVRSSLEIMKKLEDLPVVSQVETSRNRYAPMITSFRTIQWLSRVLMLCMGIVLITVIIQYSKMSHLLQIESINLLRLYGAGPWTLKWPHLIAGFALGLASGCAAAVLWVTAGPILAQALTGLAPVFGEMLKPPLGFVLFMPLLSIVLNAMASFLSYGRNGFRVPV